MKIESHRQKPSLPSFARVRLKSNVEPIASKSVPFTCSTPFTKTSYGGCTWGGRLTPARLATRYTMPLGGRRGGIRLLLAFAPALALAPHAPPRDGGLT